MQSHLPIPVLPEAVHDLLGNVEVYANLDAVDLREMSKFDERTNIHGLPIHDLTRPPDEDGLLESEGKTVDLPTSVYVDLREALRSRPQILLQGTFAGAGSHAFPVAALFPRNFARLAQAWNALMWRGHDVQSAMPRLTVIHLPEFSHSILLSLPDEALTLVLGTDDPRPGLLVAIEWANREWKSQAEGVRSGRLPRDTEPAAMLPGGSFVFRSQDHRAGKESDPVGLVFPGPSIPVSWERTLIESLPPLGICHEADLLLAGAEPWCAEGGGRVSPFWRNPLLPVPLLRNSGLWRDAALHPDALPMGVAVDASGAIDWEASPDDALVIVPRQAAPAPFADSVGPFRPATHFTHRAVKPEAMELWALGLPAPEVLGPDGGH